MAWLPRRACQRDPLMCLLLAPPGSPLPQPRPNTRPRTRSPHAAACAPGRHTPPPAHHAASVHAATQRRRHRLSRPAGAERQGAARRGGRRDAPPQAAAQPRHHARPSVPGGAGWGGAGRGGAGLEREGASLCWSERGWAGVCGAGQGRAWKAPSSPCRAERGLALLGCSGAARAMRGMCALAALPVPLRLARTPLPALPDCLPAWLGAGGGGQPRWQLRAAEQPAAQGGVRGRAARRRGGAQHRRPPAPPCPSPCFALGSQRQLLSVLPCKLTSSEVLQQVGSGGCGESGRVKAGSWKGWELAGSVGTFRYTGGARHPAARITEVSRNS